MSFGRLAGTALEQNMFLIIMTNPEIIKIGEYEVLASGVLIVPNSQTIEFKFGPLTFRVAFVRERDENGQLTEGHYTTKVIKDEVKDEPKYLLVTIFNQDNVLLSSSSTIPVATYNNKNLLLRFALNSINKSKEDPSADEDKVFYYTWLLDKDINSSND